MLANGAKLEYKKKSGAGTFTDISADLKEIPDMGVEAEKVDNTGLNDKNIHNETGIGDLGDMKYVFRYNNSGENSVVRLMRGHEKNQDVLTFKETLADGTVTQFDGTVSTKRTGAGVNGVVNFEVAIAVQSDLEYTDPSAS